LNLFSESPNIVDLASQFADLYGHYIILPNISVEIICTLQSGQNLCYPDHSKCVGSGLEEVETPL
jgi:hypothetical protein